MPSGGNALDDLRLECAGDAPFEVMVVLPVGGRGVVGTEPAFVPPWSI